MKFKKVLCAASAAVMLATVGLSGCSTPRVAMTVDGKDYTTGEYLAYLYNAYTQVYSQQLYYYASAGYTEDQIWALTLPYGEGDDKVDLELPEYLKKVAQDTMIRQKALENMMEKYDVSVSEDDLKDMDEQLKGLTDDSVIKMGFNAEHYKNMYKAVNYNEKSLFYALYDVGGKEGMTEEQMREYFEKNYLSYKAIEISLADSDGKDLSEADVTKIKKRLEGYLSQYKKDKDFDKVIEAYEADEAKSTSSSGTTTTTTTGSTTTTTTATGTTSTTEGSKTDASSSTGTTTTTTTTDPNLKNIEGADSYSDEDLLKAVQSVKEGEAKIVEYKKEGKTKTMALILRLDPEKANGKDYYKNSHEGIIYNAKYKTFNDMVKKTVDGLKVDVSDRAVKMCDPKEMLASAQ